MNRGQSTKSYCIEQMAHQSVISRVRIIKLFVFSINKNLAIMENDLKQKIVEKNEEHTQIKHRVLFYWKNEL